MSASDSARDSFQHDLESFLDELDEAVKRHPHLNAKHVVALCMSYAGMQCAMLHLDVGWAQKHFRDRYNEFFQLARQSGGAPS